MGGLALLIISWSSSTPHFFEKIRTSQYQSEAKSIRFSRCYVICNQTLSSVEDGAPFGAKTVCPSIYLHGAMVAYIYLNDMRGLDPVGHVLPAKFKLSTTTRLQRYFRRSGGICLSVWSADCGRIWEGASSSALPGLLEWQVSGHCTTAGRSLIVSGTTKLVWCHVPD